jgi:hypothetical protein
VATRGRDDRARAGAEAALAGPGREAERSATERGWRLGLVAARNAVGLVGILFFGWAPAALVVLYFADTLAGMWAVFAAVGFKLSNVDPRAGFRTLVGVLSGVAVAVALVAIVAVPLGIPLVFVLGSSGAVWHQVWADPTLTPGSGWSR